MGFAQGPGCQIYPGCSILDNVTLGSNVTVFPGAVIGRPPLSSGATTRAVAHNTLLPTIIGDNCVIGSNCVIYHDVRIGDRAMICDTACIREGVRIGDASIVAMGVTINYDTTIGSRVKIMDNTHITGNMVIEDDVFIGMLVSTANDNSMDRKGNGVNTTLMKGPVIRRFASVAQGCCLLPGIEVGENAIIGSNSVLTRDAAPESLYVGVPARRIRALGPHELKGA